MGCSSHGLRSPGWWDEETGRAPPPLDGHSWWIEERPAQSYLAPRTTRERTRVGHLALVEETPDPLSAIETAIADARQMFSRGITDAEGENDGAPFPEAFERAVSFLRNSAQLILEKDRTAVDVPEILPGPSGSIDLLWRFKRYELLVNIPPGKDTIADFYGDTPDGLTIKGNFRPEIHHQGILAWLTDRR
jgi:hypothetical protein